MNNEGSPTAGASGARPPARTNNHFILGMIAALAAVVLVLAVRAWIARGEVGDADGPGAGVTPTIRIVNAGLLISEYQRSSTPGTAANTEDLQTRLQRRLQQLSDAGVVVIDGTIVLAAPASAYLTLEELQRIDEHE